MRAIVAILLLLALVTGAAAELKVIGSNAPRVDGLVGETFEIKFEIRSDDTTNYTLKLFPREEFNFTPTEKTLEIPADDTRTFIFEGEVVEELEDGKYAIQWEAQKNGTSFDSGSFDLRVGEQGGGVAAGLRVTGYNAPRVNGLVNETFVIKFEIRSDESTNYTLKLTPRTELNFTPAEITIMIPEGDSRTFIFEGRVKQELDDGKYNLKWEAQKNGTKFDSGSFDLRAGEQATPGPGLLLAAVALAGLAAARRRRGGGSAEQGA